MQSKIVKTSEANGMVLMGIILRIVFEKQFR